MPPKRIFCRSSRVQCQSPSGKRTRFSSSKLVSVGALPLRVPAHKKARIVPAVILAHPDPIVHDTVLPQAAGNNVNNAVPNRLIKRKVAAPARIVLCRQMLNKFGSNPTEEQIKYSVSQFTPRYHKRNRIRKSKAEGFDSIMDQKSHDCTRSFEPATTPRGSTKRLNCKF